jgi:diphosphomevalonate decarboxylase
MNKITAKAPANIAFIKYWGKKSDKLRIPMNSSISMNLSDVYTITSACYGKGFKEDIVRIDGENVKGVEKERIVKFIDLVRSKTRIKEKVEIISRNNFPKGTGIASSASGFAALALALTRAVGLDLNKKELSILARLGSGSACRSIPDGFVEWKSGKTSDSSYAYTLFPPDYWNICDVIAIVGEKSKKVSSTQGHALTESSPFIKSRILGMNMKIREIKTALRKKDFTAFGQIIEEETFNMHAVMMTSNPPLIYWNPLTLKLILSIIEWRKEGLESYFTIDAGPNVHVICKNKDLNKIKGRLLKLKGVKNIIANKVAMGAHLL